MSKLATRLDKHFAACAAVAAGAAFLGNVEKADAAIQWSGIVNLNIPSTTNGIYLNVTNGQWATSGGAAAVPGWTINPWSSTGLSYWVAGGADGRGHIFRTGGGGVANLAQGDVIGAAPIYGGWSTANSSGFTTGNQPHILNSPNNLYGFRFQIAGQTHYGWARLSLGSSLAAQPRSIVEYAWEDVAGANIMAGVVPAPGALALLGLAGLVGSRRRRA